VIPLHELEIRIRVGRSIQRVYRAADGAELLWRREGDWVAVGVPKLDLYDIVVLES